MKRITVYNPAELKRKHPEAFESAYERWKDSNTDIPWSGEIMDSLKAIFKASGINLRDWEIGAWCYSYVRFNFNDEYVSESETRNLSGNRALAWLENNLLGRLRIPNIPYVNILSSGEVVKNVRSQLAQYGKYYRAGMIKPCPFTGVCFDEDFIQSLLKDIKAGDTLGEAYSNLADAARKLFEQEIEGANSEEEFLLQDHLEFTKDGRML